MTPTPTRPTEAAPRPALRGIDFSSRPDRRKPIVLAEGRWCHGSRPDATAVELTALRLLPSLADYAACLREPGPWVAGCDFPFGLPRELVRSLGWPEDWAALMDHYAALERSVIRDRFAAFCAARPAGGKFAHRACDRPAGSSPSMKWVNPPVAWMLHAGVPPLRAAGCDLPGLCPGDPTRRALEAYPGLLARELIGRRPYKSDQRARQTRDQAEARAQMLAALEAGQGRTGVVLRAPAALRAQLVADARGDTLDAVLCLLQAAWAVDRPRWGWPPQVDPLEGWILTA